jgi:hypothetical protein
MEQQKINLRDTIWMEYLETHHHVKKFYGGNEELKEKLVSHEKHLGKQAVVNKNLHEQILIFKKEQNYKF